MNNPSDLISSIKAYLEFQEEVFTLPIRPLLSTFEHVRTGASSQTQPPSSMNPSPIDYYSQLSTCTNLIELEQLCIQAEAWLKTDLEDTRLVFGDGNPKADLMIIGEAPGKNENEQGLPFVGRAGELLTKILKAIHFERSDIYIANIVKHRPPNNRDPLQEERERSLPFLIRQIELISPKIILCLGRISANTLLQSNNAMKDMRGNFYPILPGIELTATYHPAALLRNPAWKRGTWEDVQKVRARYDELGCKP